MPYLDEFVKSIASLPLELNENYSEIRKLDIHLQEHEKLLEELYERELKDAKAAIEFDGMVGNSSYSRKVTDAAEVCKAIADQKIKLATQTYKRVDGHIRRLDKYLKKFDQELRHESEPRAGTAALELKSDNSGALGKVSEINKRSQVVEQPVTMDIDLPIDPNEPTYCICNRVSFGDMIACDNENCRIEWFHYECVGIVDQPKGKWYCPECAPKMKHRKRS